MANVIPTGTGLFQTSLRALQRLQTDFKTLRLASGDLTIVQFTARRPVPDYSLIEGRAGFTAFDLSPDRSTNRLSYHDIEARRHIASWQVDDSHESLPGTDRWFYLYTDDATLSPLKIVCEEAGRLVYNAVTSGDAESNYKLVWQDIPRGWHGLHFGYWIDLVFEMGRWTLESAPISYSLFALDERYERDGTWFHNPRSADIWTNPNQPPGWEQRINRFLAASEYALDLLIEWGESRKCPWAHRLPNAGPTSDINEWLAPIDWLRSQYLQGEMTISESKFAMRFCQTPGTYNLVSWLESVQSLGPSRHGQIEIKKSPTASEFHTVGDCRVILPGIVNLVLPGMENLREIETAATVIESSTTPDVDQISSGYSGHCLTKSTERFW